jgi:hypothetical protein
MSTLLRSATFLIAALSLPGCIIQPNGEGQTGAGAWGSASNEVPQINQGEGGEWNARFSNNCVVHYTGQGQRTEQTAACSRSQIQKADTGMAATRREQGL